MLSRANDSTAYSSYLDSKKPFCDQAEGLLQAEGLSPSTLQAVLKRSTVVSLEVQKLLGSLAQKVDVTPTLPGAIDIPPLEDPLRAYQSDRRGYPNQDPRFPAAVFPGPPSEGELSRVALGLQQVNGTGGPPSYPRQPSGAAGMPSRGAHALAPPVPEGAAVGSWDGSAAHGWINSASGSANIGNRSVELSHWSSMGSTETATEAAMELHRSSSSTGGTSAVTGYPAKLQRSITGSSSDCAERGSGPRNGDCTDGNDVFTGGPPFLPRPPPPLPRRGAAPQPEQAPAKASAAPPGDVHAYVFHSHSQEGAGAACPGAYPVATPSAVFGDAEVCVAAGGNPQCMGGGFGTSSGACSMQFRSTGSGSGSGSGGGASIAGSIAPRPPSPPQPPPVQPAHTRRSSSPLPPGPCAPSTSYGPAYAHEQAAEGQVAMTGGQSGGDGSNPAAAPLAMAARDAATAALHQSFFGGGVDGHGTGGGDQAARVGAGKDGVDRGGGLEPTAHARSEGGTAKAQRPGAASDPEAALVAALAIARASADAAFRSPEARLYRARSAFTARRGGLAGAGAVAAAVARGGARSAQRVFVGVSAAAAPFPAFSPRATPSGSARATTDGGGGVAGGVAAGGGCSFSCGGASEFSYGSLPNALGVASSLRASLGAVGGGSTSLVSRVQRLLPPQVTVAGSGGGSSRSPRAGYGLGLGSDWLLPSPHSGGGSASAGGVMDGEFFRRQELLLRKRQAWAAEGAKQRQAENMQGHASAAHGTVHHDREAGWDGGSFSARSNGYYRQRLEALRQGLGLDPPSASAAGEDAPGVREASEAPAAPAGKPPAHGPEAPPQQQQPRPPHAPSQLPAAERLPQQLPPQPRPRDLAEQMQRWAAAREARLAAMRRERAEEEAARELEGLTFRPAIGERSRRLAQAARARSADRRSRPWSHSAGGSSNGDGIDIGCDGAADGNQPALPARSAGGAAAAGPGEDAAAPAGPHGYADMARAMRSEGGAGSWGRRGRASGAGDNDTGGVGGCTKDAAAAVITQPESTQAMPVSRPSSTVSSGYSVPPNGMYSAVSSSSFGGHGSGGGSGSDGPWHGVLRGHERGGEAGRSRPLLMAVAAQLAAARNSRSRGRYACGPVGATIGRANDAEAGASAALMRRRGTTSPSRSPRSRRSSAQPAAGPARQPAPHEQEPQDRTLKYPAGPPLRQQPPPQRRPKVAAPMAHPEAPPAQRGGGGGARSRSRSRSRSHGGVLRPLGEAHDPRVTRLYPPHSAREPRVPVDPRDVSSSRATAALRDRVRPVQTAQPSAAAAYGCFPAASGGVGSIGSGGEWGVRSACASYGGADCGAADGSGVGAYRHVDYLGGDGGSRGTSGGSGVGSVDTAASTNMRAVGMGPAGGAATGALFPPGGLSVRVPQQPWLSTAASAWPSAGVGAGVARDEVSGGVGRSECGMDDTRAALPSQYLAPGGAPTGGLPLVSNSGGDGATDAGVAVGAFRSSGLSYPSLAYTPRYAAPPSQPPAQPSAATAGGPVGSAGASDSAAEASLCVPARCDASLADGAGAGAAVTASAAAAIGLSGSAAGASSAGTDAPGRLLRIVSDVLDAASSAAGAGVGGLSSRGEAREQPPVFDGGDSFPAAPVCGAVGAPLACAPAAVTAASTEAAGQASPLVPLRSPSSPTLLHSFAGGRSAHGVPIAAAALPAAAAQDGDVLAPGASGAVKPASIRDLAMPLPMNALGSLASGAADVRSKTPSTGAPASALSDSVGMSVPGVSAPAAPYPAAMVPGPEVQTSELHARGVVAARAAVTPGDANAAQRAPSAEDSAMTESAVAEATIFLSREATLTLSLPTTTLTGPWKPEPTAAAGAEAPVVVRQEDSALGMLSPVQTTAVVVADFSAASAADPEADATSELPSAPSSAGSKAARKGAIDAAPGDASGHAVGTAVPAKASTAADRFAPPQLDPLTTGGTSLGGGGGRHLTPFATAAAAASLGSPPLGRSSVGAAATSSLRTAYGSMYDSPLGSKAASGSIPDAAVQGVLSPARGQVSGVVFARIPSHQFSSPSTASNTPRKAGSGAGSAVATPRTAAAASTAVPCLTSAASAGGATTGTAGGAAGEFLFRSVGGALTPGGVASGGGAGGSGSGSGPHRRLFGSGGSGSLTLSQTYDMLRRIVEGRSEPPPPYLPIPASSQLPTPPPSPAPHSAWPEHMRELRTTSGGGSGGGAASGGGRLCLSRLGTPTREVEGGPLDTVSQGTPLGAASPVTPGSAPGSAVADEGPVSRSGTEGCELARSSVEVETPAAVSSGSTGGRGEGSCCAAVDSSRSGEHFLSSGSGARESNHQDCEAAHGASADGPGARSVAAVAAAAGDSTSVGKGKALCGRSVDGDTAEGGAADAGGDGSKDDGADVCDGGDKGNAGDGSSAGFSPMGYGREYARSSLGSMADVCMEYGLDVYGMPECDGEYDAHISISGGNGGGGGDPDVAGLSGIEEGVASGAEADTDGGAEGRSSASTDAVTLRKEPGSLPCSPRARGFVNNHHALEALVIQEPSARYAADDGGGSAFTAAHPCPANPAATNFSPGLTRAAAAAPTTIRGDAASILSAVADRDGRDVGAGSGAPAEAATADLCRATAEEGDQRGCVQYNGVDAPRMSSDAFLAAHRFESSRSQTDSLASGAAAAVAMLPAVCAQPDSGASAASAYISGSVETAVERSGSGSATSLRDLISQLAQLGQPGAPAATTAATAPRPLAGAAAASPAFSHPQSQREVDRDAGSGSSGGGAAAAQGDGAVAAAAAAAVMAAIEPEGALPLEELVRRAELLRAAAAATIMAAAAAPSALPPPPQHQQVPGLPGSPVRYSLQSPRPYAYSSHPGLASHSLRVGLQPSQQQAHDPLPTALGPGPGYVGAGGWAPK